MAMTIKELESTVRSQAEKIMELESRLEQWWSKDDLQAIWLDMSNEKIRIAKEALEFYADDKNYHFTHMPERMWTKAKEALTEIRK